MMPSCFTRYGPAEETVHPDDSGRDSYLDLPVRYG